jgi:hypothetical protein
MKRFLKQFSGIVMWAFVILFAIGVSAAVTKWSNSRLELYQKAMVFTSNGISTGTKVMWINSWGNIITYGTLKDQTGNIYTTYAVMDTGVNNPTSDTLVLTEKATINYITWYMSSWNLIQTKVWATAATCTWDLLGTLKFSGDNFYGCNATTGRVLIN